MQNMSLFGPLRLDDIRACGKFKDHNRATNCSTLSVFALFIKTNSTLKSDCNKYRNKLTNIIRTAKLNYQTNFLNKLNNIALKLFVSHQITY